MSDRLIKPLLAITLEPSSEIKFLKSCQYNETSRRLTKDFHELSLECQLKNMDVNNLPNINLYVSASIVLANIDGSNSVNHPFVLKCACEKTRQLSKLLQPNARNNAYLFALNKETMKCLINSLYVIISSPEELEEYFENIYVESLITTTSSRIVTNVSGSGETYSRSSSLTADDLAASTSAKEQAQLQAKTLEENLDSLSLHVNRNKQSNKELNKLRLKLQVVIHNLTTNKLENYLTEPLYTKIIENGSPKFSRVKNEIENTESIWVLFIKLF